MSGQDLPSFSPEISPDLADIVDLSQVALDLVSGSKSVAQSLATLVSNELFQDATVALANGLTKEAAVLWSVESAKMVADKLPESELEALSSAEDWLASGGAAADELAAALDGNEMQGPGGWAALAADWASKAWGLVTGEAPPYAKAVVGAVKLAAALSKQDWPLFESPEGVDAPDKSNLGSTADAAGLVKDAVGLVKDVVAAQSESPAMDAAASAMEAAESSASSEQALNDLLKPFVELGMKLAAESPPPAVSADSAA